MMIKLISQTSCLRAQKYNKLPMQRTQATRPRSELGYERSLSEDRPLTQAEQARQHQEHRKCECCNNKVRYHDYLAEFRKQRAEKMQRKKIAQAYMQSKIPLIESGEMAEDLAGEYGNQDRNFAARFSNKKSEYEETPRKGILQSFHEGIISSHSKNPRRSQMGEGGSSRIKRSSSSRVAEDSSFMFEIEISNEDSSEVYCRSFTAIEYGVKALEYIEVILGKAS